MGPENGKRSLVARDIAFLSNERPVTARRNDFTIDDKGAVVTGNLDNIRLGLAKLRIQPVFDAFARDLRIDGRPIDDHDLERLWVRFSDAFGWRPTRDDHPYEKGKTVYPNSSQRDSGNR